MFEVGDKVRAFGVDGVVDEVIKSDTYPIKVRYYISKYHGDSFTLDGKIADWHKEPTLVLVEKAKKKVTKTLERWANVYDGFVSTYPSKSEADSNADEERIACVKLTGTYVVEE